MNVSHNKELRDSTSDAQKKLSKILNESQDTLKLLMYSLRRSNEFNKKAAEYLSDSKRFISSLTNKAQGSEDD